ncbi:hypothetical protein WJX72_010143 [[Myrmecia] bisecta]|uniref:Uncharacterized protein n=1 Tax=[Myrmecia] bisecta TaxID=41462 RepID=A0AAW1R850_9CHLO
MQTQKDAAEERAAALQLRAESAEGELEAVTAEEQAEKLHALQAELDTSYENLKASEEHAMKLEEDVAFAREASEMTANEQVAAMQARLDQAEQEAEYHRHLAERSENVMLEMQRLADDNKLLTVRMKQMEIDIKELTNTSGLGHNNSKQKIQYHLRLKQELEEMRHECMLLLRERFNLEQCVRYLAVRASLPFQQEAQAEFAALGRSPLEKNPLQPSSLMKHHLFATPISRRSMMLAGRGRRAAEEGSGTTWQSKADIQAAIESAVTHTAESLQDILDEANGAFRDVGKENTRHTPPKGEPGLTDQEDMYTPAPGAAGCGDGRPDEAGVEARIVARIAQICSPGRKTRTSRLMQAAGKGDVNGTAVKPRMPLLDANLHEDHLETASLISATPSLRSLGRHATSSAWK